jgi:ERCC4-type nuclease
VEVSLMKQDYEKPVLIVYEDLTEVTMQASMHEA